MRVYFRTNGQLHIYRVETQDHAQAIEAVKREVLHGHGPVLALISKQPAKDA